jgi:hypothetical protein
MASTGDFSGLSDEVIGEQERDRGRPRVLPEPYSRQVHVVIELGV